MGTSEILSAVVDSEVSVGDAIAIIIISGPLGGIFGGSFTAHVVSEETRAVWMTTVAIAILGLIILSARS